MLSAVKMESSKEKIGKSSLYSAHELWLALDEVDNNQENVESVKLKMAIKKLHQMASLLNSTSLCDASCLKAMRDMVIQLKLICWGYYGAAESRAGIFLAHHRNHIGPYFTNSHNNQWPFHPLHKEPTALEVSFNGELISSNGQIFSSINYDLVDS